MEKKLYLRVVISKTGREDSLSQKSGEIKQKHAISVGVNTTLGIQWIYYPVSSLSRCREYDGSSGARTDNGAIIRADSPCTAHALWTSGVDSTIVSLHWVLCCHGFPSNSCFQDSLWWFQK